MFHTVCVANKLSFWKLERMADVYVGHMWSCYLDSPYQWCSPYPCKIIHFQIKILFHGHDDCDWVFLGVGFRGGCLACIVSSQWQALTRGGGVVEQVQQGITDTIDSWLWHHRATDIWPNFCLTTTVPNSPCHPTNAIKVPKKKKKWGWVGLGWTYGPWSMAPPPKKCWIRLYPFSDTN